MGTQHLSVGTLELTKSRGQARGGPQEHQTRASHNTHPNSGKVSSGVIHCTLSLTHPIHRQHLPLTKPFICRKKRGKKL